MSFTVKATQGGATAAGTALRVVVLTGTALASAQTGATATQNGAAAHEQSITTTVTGSQVYGATWVSSASTFTAASGTTFIDNVHEADGLTHGTCRTTSATGTPGSVTVGSTAPTTTGSIALAELLPAGTITQDASGPAFIYQNTGTAATTAAFTPPNASLLLALVSSNGGAGVTTMAMSDTSGLGLTWSPLVQENPSGGAYAGVWIAQMAGAMTASASLAVTPSFTASRARGRFRTGSLSVSPSFTAQRVRGRFRTGSLTVSPSFTASRVHGHARTGLLTVVPVTAAGRVQGHARLGSLAVSPLFTAGVTVFRPTPVGSWYGLLSVLRHSEQEFDAYNSRPPLACPQCGEPLINSPSTKSGSGVQLFCKYDSWQFPRDWRPDVRLGGGGY